MLIVAAVLLHAASTVFQARFDEAWRTRALTSQLAVGSHVRGQMVPSLFIATTYFDDCDLVLSIVCRPEGWWFLVYFCRHCVPYVF